MRNITCHEIDGHSLPHVYSFSLLCVLHAIFCAKKCLVDSVRLMVRNGERVVGFSVSLKMYKMLPRISFTRHG